MTGNRLKCFLFFVYSGYYAYLRVLIINRVNKVMIKRLIIVFIGIVGIIPIQLRAKRYYCEIKGIEKEFTSGLKIVFDFGESQVYSIWGGLKNKQKLVDENGDEIDFNSMVDAANYMSDKGWNFQQAYTSFYSGNAIHHWIFYKEAETKEEAGKGIMTKETYKNK